MLANLTHAILRGGQYVIQRKCRRFGEAAISAQAVAQTEEATKNALVMPFIRVLGFDVFDPTRVIPEYVAEVGLKKGVKIDYAVKIGSRSHI